MFFGTFWCVGGDPTHKCLSAKRSLHLNVETEPRQECIPVGCVPAAHWRMPGGSPYRAGGSPCGGVGLLGGASFPRGSPCWGEGASSQGGLLAGGSHCQGTSLPGGLLTRGVPPSRGSPCQGGLLPEGFLTGRPIPPVDGITDMSKNITLATTLLQPVTRMHSSRMHTIHCSGCGRGGCMSARGCLPGGVCLGWVCVCQWGCLP